MLGKGFVLLPQQAEDLVQRDPRNREVLFPYLNGEDLNSRPDCSASRWVINFHDWTEERAREYPEPFAIVEKNVKPERQKNKNKQRREIWWRFTRPAMEMQRAIKDLDRILVVALVSRTVMPVAVPTGQVFSHMLGVFATSDFAHLALLNSSIHYAWANARASTLKGDLRYTPSDIYETMPFPSSSAGMEVACTELDEIRRSVMLERNLGLTKLYNLFHDPGVMDEDIRTLRAAHIAVDHAVVETYEWKDLQLHHGFQTARENARFDLPRQVKMEVVDRLIELNHAQYAGGSDLRIF